MSKLNLGTPKNQWCISGLSRSALLKRRSTPGTSATASPKPEIKTSLSTPRTTSAISKITDKTVITKKKLEFAGRKLIEEEKEKPKEEKAQDVIDLSSDDESNEYESLTDAQLTEILQERQKSLEVFQRHQKEKAQLIDYTAKWKDAGNNALDSLEEYLRMSRKELMIKMRLDDDIFD